MAATSTSAAFNGYSYSGKFGSHGATKEMELNHDFHLKMSKKIAQLTKVIYALNTKNDEHELILASVKEQHEGQIQSIFAETRNKVEYYRQKLSELKEEVSRTSQNEESAKASEAEKLRMKKEIELLRQNAEKAEMRLKTEHAEKVKSLREEFVGVKKELEARLVQVDGLSRRYQKEKENAVNEVEGLYKKRLEAAALLRDQHFEQLESLRKELKTAHEAELGAMRQKLDAASAEKRHLQADFDAKHSKAQSFYEKELEALKNLQNSSHEERYKALADSYEKLRNEKSLGDSLTRQRIDELQSQLSRNEEIINKLKDRESNLAKDLSTTESSVVRLNAELSQTKNNLNRLQGDFVQQKTEFSSMKMISEQQAKDLMTKSGRIAELESSTMQQNATIKDLTEQRDDFKQRIAVLESLRQNLEKNSLSQVEEQEIRLRTLQKSVDELTASKEKMTQKHEEEIGRMKQSSNGIQEKLMSDHRLVVDAANQRHAQELSTERLQAETKLTRVKEDLESHLDRERKEHEKKMEASRQEFEQTKEDLDNQLSTAKKEIERLEALVHEGQESLLAASGNLMNIRDSSQALRSELDITTQKLKQSRDEATALQNECDGLKNLHKEDLKKADEKLKSELQLLQNELENKWKNRLKSECDQLRKEMLDQRHLDQKAAIDQLVKVKDAEFATAKREWERKVTQLLAEITDFKKQLSMAEKMQSQKLENLEKQKGEELHQLRFEMMSSKDEHARKVDDLKTMYTDEIESLIRTHKEEMKNFEDELKRCHMAELKAQVDSHKIVVATLRDEHENEKKLELDALLRQNQQDMEDVRVELEQRMVMEVERLTRAHSEDVRAARLELNRALELSREKDGENAKMISDLQETVKIKEDMVGRLKEEINSLQESLENLKRDLEQKGKDMIRLRKEMNRALKAQEAELEKQHSESRLALESSHLSRTQELIRDFASSQQLLKTKITQLQDMLDEAEEKYRNRESREEDVEKIRSLNSLLLSKEEDIKKLNADKKHFQLELVNRETNFNKVFNADPKVGVLNPLAAAKAKPKSTKDGPQRIGSGPSIGTGLNPLPGSPFHDETLNGFKPLPPLPKKFLQ